MDQKKITTPEETFTIPQKIYKYNKHNYFSEYTRDHYEYNYTIFKSDSNGQNKIKLADDAYIVSVIEDWIYYSRSGDFGTYLCRIKPDDSNYSLIANLTSEFGFPYEEWVYFYNRVSTVTINNVEHRIHALYRIKKDGTNFEKFADIDGRNVEIHNDWIYCYGNIRIEENRLIKGLMRISMDGKEINKVFELNETDNDITYKIEGEWVFYKVWERISDPVYINFEPKLYKIKVDGTEKELIHEEINIPPRPKSGRIVALPVPVEILDGK